MLTEAYGADSVKSGFSLGYRLKNAWEAMKDEKIGHPMTRRTDGTNDVCLCWQTIQCTNYDKGSKTR